MLFSSIIFLRIVDYLS